MLGISQEELAKQSGVGRASVDRLERGLARTIRVTEAVQRALEAEGVRFVEASKDSAGGVLLPPDPENTPCSRRQGSSGNAPAKRGSGF
jgi:transcriptional regulator with XRE-family HTH domain